MTTSAISSARTAPRPNPETTPGILDAPVIGRFDELQGSTNRLFLFSHFDENGIPQPELLAAARKLGERAWVSQACVRALPPEHEVTPDTAVRTLTYQFLGSIAQESVQDLKGTLWLRTPSFMPILSSDVKELTPDESKLFGKVHNRVGVEAKVLSSIKAQRKENERLAAVLGATSSLRRGYKPVIVLTEDEPSISAEQANYGERRGARNMLAETIWRLDPSSIVIHNPNLIGAPGSNRMSIVSQYQAMNQALQVRTPKEARAPKRLSGQLVCLDKTLPKAEEVDSDTLFKLLEQHVDMLVRLR